MRLSFFFSSVFLIAGCSIGQAAPPDEPNRWTPPRELVAKVDALVLKMSSQRTEAKPLAGYVRYYWGTVQSGRKVLEGVFVNPIWTAGHSPGFYVVLEKDTPHIADGGCDVVHATWDVVSAALSPVWCNFELPPPPPH